MTWLNAPSGKKQDRLPVRAAEHNVIMASGDGKEEVSETCTVITTLLDHEAAPADAVRDTYLTRWSASETTFGEDKTTITGAGNRTSGPVLRSGSPRLVIQEAWAWLTATQLVRASEAAALRSEAAAARALRRRDAVPVTADEESFTAARLHMLRSMESTQVNAHLSLDAITTAADGAARAALHVLNVPGRQRHAGRRAQKARPKFPHATGTKTTVTGKPQVTVFAPELSASSPPQIQAVRKEEPPPPRGRGPWNRAPGPPRHAGPAHARTPATPPRKQTQEHVQNTKGATPQKDRNTSVLGTMPSTSSWVSRTMEAQRSKMLTFPQVRALISINPVMDTIRPQRISSSAVRDRDRQMAGRAGALRSWANTSDRPTRTSSLILGRRA